MVSCLLSKFWNWLTSGKESVSSAINYSMDSLYSGTQTVDGMLSPQIARQNAWIDPHNGVVGAIKETAKGLDVLSAVLSVLTPLPGEGGAIQAGSVLTRTIETTEGPVLLQFVVKEVSGGSIKGVAAIMHADGILIKTNPGPRAIKAAVDSLKAELKAAGIQRVEAGWLQMSPTQVRQISITIR